MERARDLLSHAVPGRSIEEVHLRAMRLLVAELEKRKFAKGYKPRPHGSSRESHAGASSASDQAAETSLTQETFADEPATEDEADVHEPDAHEPDAHDPDTHECVARPVTGGGSLHAEAAADARRRCGVVTRSRRGGHSHVPVERPSGRYFPAHVRREVCERDAGRCAFVSEDGQRCQETSFLELHHPDPYAHGGAALVDNIALRCKAHNALAAEVDFGRTFMARRLRSGRE